MSDLTISFECDNAAFEDPAVEAVRILRDLATKIENGSRDGKVSDINGNIIGSYALDIDDPEADVTTAQDVIDRYTRAEIVERLEDTYGFQCRDSESTQALAEALANQIDEEGDIL